MNRLLSTALAAAAVVIGGVAVDAPAGATPPCRTNWDLGPDGQCRPIYSTPINGYDPYDPSGDGFLRGFGPDSSWEGSQPTITNQASAEQRYVLQASTLASLRHPDKVILDVGYLACSVRRNGQSSDQAKVAVSNKLSRTYKVLVPGAVAGSLVHMAVDNLCPEVGYP